MTGPVPYDAGNAKHVQDRKRLEQLGEAGNDEAWRDVIATESGRRVLYLIAADCGWRGSVWDSSSARQSDFNAGLQQAGFNLMGRFARLSGPHFLAALDEATKRDTEAEMLRAAVLTPSVEEQNEQENDNG